MKTMKKIFALLVTMIMVFGMSTSVFAADPTPDNSISVTGLTIGDKVASYQVIEWKDGEGWVFKAPFDALSDADLEIILGKPEVPDDPDTPDDEHVDAEAGKITQDLADRIAKLASGETPVEISDTTWTQSNPNPGLYMVIIAAKDPGVVYNPAFVAADYIGTNTTNTIAITETYSDTAVAKKTTFTTKKTVKDAEDAINKAKASMVGDTVDFVAESKIPVFLDSYKNPFFEMNDAVSDGMELVIDAQHPLEITYGTKAVAVTSDTYSDSDLTFTKNDNKTYTIKFTTAYLTANDRVKVDDLKVEYSAKITSEAKFNVNWQKNTVTVTYSNGPTSEKGVERDVTNHYEFSIGAEIVGTQHKKGYEAVKVGVDKNGNELTELTEIDLDNGFDKATAHSLAGAKFGLYNTQAGATAETAGDLVINTNYPNGALFTTTADGIITFTGLDAGTYYLKELEAPQGYIRDTAVHTVVIDAKYVVKNFTETVSGIEVTYQTSVLDYYTVTIDGHETKYIFDNDGDTLVDPVINDVTTDEARIKNTKGVELPSTGGIGTTIFYLVGTALVIAAAMMLITRRRMDGNK